MLAHMFARCDVCHNIPRRVPRADAGMPLADLPLRRITPLIRAHTHSLAHSPTRPLTHSVLRSLIISQDSFKNLVLSSAKRQDVPRASTSWTFLVVSLRLVTPIKNACTVRTTHPIHLSHSTLVAAYPSFFGIIVFLRFPPASIFLSSLSSLLTLLLFAPPVRQRCFNHNLSRRTLVAVTITVTVTIATALHHRCSSQLSTKEYINHHFRTNRPAPSPPPALSSPPPLR